MSTLVSIFGKRGSGKSTLTKEYMMFLGGKVVFLSPVEDLKSYDYVIWKGEEIKIEPVMSQMKQGEILIVKSADELALNYIACSAIIHKDFTIAIDEVERYVSNSKENELKDLIHFSRHARLNVIANTRRYVDTPRLLTSEADELCVFTTREPRDITYFKQYTDLSFEDIQVLSDLKPYTYLHHPSREIRHTSIALM